MVRMARKPMAALVAAATMAASILPAEAMPLSGVRGAGFDISNVETVGWSTERRHVRRQYRPPPPPPPRACRNCYNDYYPRGYYSRPPGPGWGWNGDAWVPLAVLGAGALIIGGAAAAANNNNRVPVQSGNGINPRHYEWCYDKYRSYRASDNTFQPYHGPRKQCYSPYY